MHNKKLKKRNEFNLKIFLIGINFIVCLLIASCSHGLGQKQFLLLYGQRTGPPELVTKIYSVHPNGSNLQLVMELDRRITEQYWLSPNGGYLALLNQEAREVPSTTPLVHTLAVMDLSSKETIVNIIGVGNTRFGQLSNESSVVWSPQGDKLAFVRNSTDEVGTDIWLYDLNTALITPLTDDDAFDLAPAWSPGGAQIAFVTGTMCRGNVEECPINEAFWELAVINVDGSNQQTLTNFHNNDFFNSGGWATLLCNLSWSPNEGYIAFENECADLMGPPTGKEAFVITTDSSLLFKLTDFNKEGDVNSTIFRYAFHWPSSSATLFIGYSKIPYNPNDSYQGGFLTLEAGNFTGTVPDDVTSMLGNTAKWSLNEQYVAWHNANINADRRTIPGRVTIGTVENNQISKLVSMERLPYGSCQERAIHWSPDGQYVAYAMVEQENICDDTERGIAVVSLSDGKVTNVAESMEGDNHLIGWVPLDTLR